MTGELILFEGHEVRTFEQDGEVWMPVYDLSLAWGLDRTTLLKHVERNADFFEGCSRRMDNLSPVDNMVESLLCVNEEGLYLLLARVSTKRVKNPTAKLSIIRFRKMVPKLIRKERIEMTTPLIQEEIDRAKLLAQITGGELKEFQKIALKKCGYGDYAPALDVPLIVHGETGWYNPTRLVTLCNDPDLTAERLNWYLSNKGYQYRDGYIWRLTPEGLIHGREYQYEAPSGHREIRISWRESILYASGLKRLVDEHQLSLPARA